MPTILYLISPLRFFSNVRRIYDRLTAHYGEHSVFMDVDNIPFGTDFRAHIRETLQRSDILIAVIGTKWLGANTDGTSRMQEKTDPVRVEIETALERKIPILPGFGRRRKDASKAQNCPSSSGVSPISTPPK